MTDAIRTLLIMSITGSILALLLFAIKPLARDRLPKSAQYYLWLVILFALLVPLSMIVVLPDNSPLPAAPVQSVV
ncbi:MAG: M56 family metallopeptidase, partial [Clostridiales bacterium]|nr:M56 family metallopeptidase [Clostridiales bacterium]